MFYAAIRLSRRDMADPSAAAPVSPDGLASAIKAAKAGETRPDIHFKGCWNDSLSILLESTASPIISSTTTRMEDGS